MIEEKTKTIGNNLYTVRQLSASEGRKMLMFLTRKLGAAFGTLIEGLGGGKATVQSVMDMDMEVLAKAIREFVLTLEGNELDHLCEVFGKCTRLSFLGPDGTRREVPLTLENQELQFMGKYLEMFKWLGFCLEVNFSDFFVGSRTLKVALGNDAAAVS